jgi:O-antigen/teichoic acid export membrane protein
MALSGVRWTYLGTAIQFTLQFAYQAFINRLLDPAAFGIMAIGLLAQRFGSYFASMGFEQALIQKPDLTEEDIRTAFTLNVAFGFGLFGIVWVAAPVISGYFEAPESVSILRAIGASLILTAAGMTSSSLLKRELRFKELVGRNTAAYVVGFPVVGLGLAALGAGVWSLVAAVITGVATAALLGYLSVRHSLRPTLNLRSARSLLHFGGRATVLQLMGWAGSNLDTVAVGRYSTTAMLGQYNRAYFLTSYPTQKLANDLMQVLFPSFSRIQDDPIRLRRVYLGATSVAAFVLLPVCAGLAVASPEVVRVILGPQWDTAIVLLPIMALAVAFDLISRVAAVVAQAKAELNKKIVVHSLTLGSLVVLLLLARGHGVWAFAAALAAANAVRNFLYASLMRSMVGAGVVATWRAYLPGLAAAMALAVAVWATRSVLLAGAVPVLVVLVADMFVGAAVLWAVFRFGPVGAVRDEVHTRLASTQLLRRSGPVGRVARLLFGAPRRTG